MKESRIKKLKIAVWLPHAGVESSERFSLRIWCGTCASKTKDIRRSWRRMNAETCSERMHGELNMAFF